MKPGSWPASVTRAQQQRAAGAAPRDVATPPGILVVGSVAGVRSLEQVGCVQRAGCRAVKPRAVRHPAELVVVGEAVAAEGDAAVIKGLKDDPATAAVPVLHAGEEACPGGCGADFCLSAGAAPGLLARVAEALLELARARARSSGLVAARAARAGRPAAPPAA
jgi:hypothetical protein